MLAPVQEQWNSGSIRVLRWRVVRKAECASSVGVFAHGAQPFGNVFSVPTTRTDRDLRAMALELELDQKRYLHVRPIFDSLQRRRN